MKWPALLRGKKWVLFGALGSLAFVVMGSDDAHGPAKMSHAKAQQVAVSSSKPVEARKNSSLVASVEFERMLRKKQQSDGGMEIGNAFNTVSWHVAQAPARVLQQPPPPPPVPQEPVAPPLPFAYLGQYRNSDSQAPIIILARSDRVYTVSEGDVIDSTYRIGPVTAGLLEITYLPLNIRQSLNTGAS
jgi:hypothetical protein